MHDDAEREDIRPTIERLCADLLRRHVRELSLDGSGHRLARSICGFRDAEVDDLHLARVEDEDVVRRHVAMNEPERLVAELQLVRRVKSSARLRQNVQHHAGSDALLRLCEPLRQCRKAFAFEVLHDEKELTAIVPQLVDLHHVGMPDVDHETRLIQKHVPKVLLTCEVREDALDDDGPTEPAWARLSRQEELGHATSGQEASDLVLPDHSAVRAGGGHSGLSVASDRQMPLRTFSALPRREGMSSERNASPKQTLEDLRIASPCKADWTKMAGDERVRFCGSCEKYVYNVTGLSRPEAEALVSGQGEVCVRLSRRADGTVITNDCPVGATSKARRLKVAALATGGLLAASALLLRNRVFADEAEPPQAKAHLDDLDLGASPAKPSTGGSFWSDLAKLVRKEPEPHVLMGDISEPLPPPPVMGGISRPHSEDQPVLPGH